MIVNENGSRYEDYSLWEEKKNTPYDYKRNGLYKRLLSHKITETNNFVTQTMLKFTEVITVFLLKYVDEVKHFKDYNWKNR